MANQFQQGYQEALRDVLQAVERDGLAGGLKWIVDNSIADPDVAASARDMLSDEVSTNA